MVCTFHAKNSIRFCEFHAVLLFCFFFFGLRKLHFFWEFLFPLFLGHLFYIYIFDKSTYFFSEKIYIMHIYNVTIMAPGRETSELGWKVLSFVFFSWKEKRKKKKGFIPKSLERVGKFLFTKPVWIEWS